MVFSLLLSLHLSFLSNQFHPNLLVYDHAAPPLVASSYAAETEEAREPAADAAYAETTGTQQYNHPQTADRASPYVRLGQLAAVRKQSLKVHSSTFGSAVVARYANRLVSSIYAGLTRIVELGTVVFLCGRGE